MSEWPIEDDGRAFKPLPETWLDHPRSRDPSKEGPRCLAVSCFINGGRVIRVRYAHPVSGNIIETFGTAIRNPDGDGYVPVGLVDGSGWPRSFVPTPGEPHDTIRSCEREHLRELWAGRIADLDLPYEREELGEDPEQRLIADGGRISGCSGVDYRQSGKRAVEGIVLQSSCSADGGGGVGGNSSTVFPSFLQFSQKHGDIR